MLQRVTSLEERRFRGNPSRSWFRLRHPLRILHNSFWVMALKYLPPCELKCALYRSLLGTRIGRDVAISPDVILDPFFPERISIGDGATLGWGARVFAHEFWPDRVRLGPVRIGKRVLVGGFSVVRPGVSITDDVVVASNSFVNKSILRPGVYGGIPVRLLRKRKGA